MTAPNTPAANDDTSPDTTDAQPATESPAEEQQAPGPAGGDEPETEPAPNSEAARYRVQRNEARTERDALAERVAGYQRRECERIIADVLEVPGDLWDIARADVASFINEDGTVDEDELRASAEALINSRPGLAKSAPRPAPQWGQHSGPAAGQAAWASVLNASR
ncbi:hypothetical protein [Mycobacterium sp. PSTR-4-N]|uniref:hypothetical protein n=1 Tax=Mycobacterium sp. PSTR-4-N TaxID=2917745 RepID=UPI001F14D544|nr:hypothetical protein [Mycobacterium sp. PSTR-4-N]MCG7597835.1 hypothetical protein [Mycobacterium sp. PSTR-4-N]